MKEETKSFVSCISAVIFLTVFSCGKKEMLFQKTFKEIGIMNSKITKGFNKYYLLNYSNKYW